MALPEGVSLADAFAVLYLAFPCIPVLQCCIRNTSRWEEQWGSHTESGYEYCNPMSRSSCEGSRRLSS